MKINSPALSMPLLCVLTFACLAPSSAQTPEGPPAQATQSVSAIMRPALDTIQQALAGVRLLKWKTSSAMRDETTANINSILHDIDATLPPLLAAADAAPGSVTHSLPAFRNTEALYDVLLRVTEAGRFAAPREQSAALQQSLDSLEAARRAFADHLQASSVARDQQVHALQTTIVTLQHRPASAPVTLPCPTPRHTTRKHYTRHKAAEKKPEEKKAVAPGTQNQATPSPK